MEPSSHVWIGINIRTLQEDSVKFEVGDLASAKTRFSSGSLSTEKVVLYAADFLGVTF